MEENHVGKKRRKEIRKAAVVKQEMNKLVLRAVIVMLAATVISSIVMIGGGKLGLFSDYTTLQTVGLVIIFIGVVAASFSVTKWVKKSQEFNAICAKYSVTGKDIKSFKRGEV